MSISVATIDDIDALKQVARKAILTSVVAEDHEKDAIIRDTDKHINQNIDSTNCVFLKHKINQVSGFILIQEFWNLSDLFVVPDRHGEKIGSKLLKKAVNTCRKVNSRGYICVNSSTNAEGFYRKHGFVSLAPESDVPDFVVPLVYRFHTGD